MRRSSHWQPRSPLRRLYRYAPRPRHHSPLQPVPTSYRLHDRRSGFCEYGSRCWSRFCGCRSRCRGSSSAASNPRRFPRRPRPYARPLCGRRAPRPARRARVAVCPHTALHRETRPHPPCGGTRARPARARRHTTRRRTARPCLPPPLHYPRAAHSVLERLPPPRARFRLPPRPSGAQPNHPQVQAHPTQHMLPVPSTTTVHVEFMSPHARRNHRARQASPTSQRRRAAPPRRTCSCAQHPPRRRYQNSRRTATWRRSMCALSLLLHDGPEPEPTPTTMEMQAIARAPTPMPQLPPAPPPSPLVVVQDAVHTTCIPPPNSNHVTVSATPPPS
ncbi:hypothetical protein C8J57DRAFT_119926 [Mycena rebaudengoi]|nr:hypothetical protein C8J57DRAFT_119926 [Mycena rebaudengoi]